MTPVALSPEAAAHVRQRGGALTLRRSPRHGCCRGPSVLFGHTHEPYHKALAAEAEAGETVYRHAVNAGSGGKPKDGDPARATSS